ncbi:MAG TPA: Lrp/AsnC family transcriptional regulator [Amycolatopsis sp.]|jgi:DNA-binding Lrp family transcriptional regulator|nr:Lrp/AsnC family transcriptional regulator [Amycolatopsis sp.]
MPTPNETLSPLDRRIVGALQIDGRASWRRIAAILDVPERTVARRGTRLLDEGAVVVTGLAIWPPSAASWLVQAQCTPGTARPVARALARRTDSIFTYIVTGQADVVAELRITDDQAASLLLDELPAVNGLVRASATPSLRPIRGAHEWLPNLLEPAEREALRASKHERAPRADPTREPPSAVDRLLLKALAENGRRTTDELGRLCGVSEATARRRVDALRSEGLVVLRAVVEPALLGFPVEALVWLHSAPSSSEALGRALHGAPAVRWAIESAGHCTFVVDLVAADRAALRELVTASQWSQFVDHYEISTVLESLKRSAVLSAGLREQT